MITNRKIYKVLLLSNNMENENKIDYNKSHEINEYLTENLRRIKTVLEFYKENPERLKFNKKYVEDICNLYFKLRSKSQEKFDGFDFMNEKDYGPIEYDSDKIHFLRQGVSLDKKIFCDYSDIYGLVVNTRSKLGLKY